MVNFVDDRDLCLLYCVKYDSCLITGFVVQSAHFQKLPLPVLFFGAPIPNKVIFTGYRFYSSEFKR